jgi:hypothetical protein
MAADELLGARPIIAALDPSTLVPILTLVGALLLGALVIAIIRRWRPANAPLSPSASDQLAQFRRLYEQGAISEEEFKRLRAVLGEEIRRAIDLPARPTEPSKPPEQTSQPTPGHEPPAETGPPPAGIKPV